MFGRPSVPIVAQAEDAKIARPKFPRTVAGMFLVCDAIAVFGAVTFPPMIASTLTEYAFKNPTLKMATMQLLVPVFSQVFMTPIHLLRLDVHNHPHSISRMSRIRKNLGETTLVRGARIISACGVGPIANSEHRDYFHAKVRYVTQVA